MHQKLRKSKAGRKTHDIVLMFKMLILQQLYNISNDELECQVND
ncbi:transposase [Cyanobacteria bacterium FACHB-63]|nr:transposase [Cyanobacteria bacterium FACHB-63]